MRRTAMIGPAGWIGHVMACCLLMACVDGPDGNPYDPEGEDTVPGEVRIALKLPPLDPDDELGDPSLLAEALRGFEIVARVDGAAPDARDWRPVEPADDIGIVPDEDGRGLLVRTLRAPRGDYIVRIGHRSELFLADPVSVSIDLAERATEVTVPLARAWLGVSARFVFGEDPPPADSWFELRGLWDGDDDCILDGRSIHQVPIDGLDALTEVHREQFTPRPIMPYVCGLVRGPGFQVFSWTHATPIHPPDEGSDAPIVNPVRFVRPFDPEPIRARINVFGVPEARVLRAGGTIAAAERAPGAVGRVQVGSRLVLLRVKLEGLLRFADDDAADERVENRVRRIAVLDAATGSGSVERGRFHPVDDLPHAIGLPYIGALDPGACLAVDPASLLMHELLNQPDDPEDDLTGLAERILELQRNPTERLLPLCLGGEGALQVLLEVEDGTVHTFTVPVFIDRDPVRSVTVTVTEDRPQIEDEPAQRRESVLPWRGRFAVHARSEIDVKMTVTDPSAEGSPLRVTAVVLDGGSFDAGSGWRVPSCPDALSIVADQGRATIIGRVGPEFVVPIEGLASPPAPAPTGPLRVHRNRVCFYIEDNVGNVRRHAVDIDTVDGRLRAELRPSAGQDPDTGAQQWVRSGCRWPLETCFDPQRPGLAGVLPENIINDRIVFSADIDGGSVDPSALLPADQPPLFEIADPAQFEYALAALVVETDEGTYNLEPRLHGTPVSHDFDSDGFHTLEVYGHDLLGRRIPFVHRPAPQAASTEAVRFLRDTRVPRVASQEFLVCAGCQRRSFGCEARPGNGCASCVDGSFVDGDTLLMPAGPQAPTVHVLSDFFVYGQDDEEQGLCGVTLDRTNARQMTSMCGNVVDVRLEDIGGRFRVVDDPLQPPEEISPVGVSPDPNGIQTVRLSTHIVDPTCNAYEPEPGEPLIVRIDGAPPRLVVDDDEGQPAPWVGCHTTRLVCPEEGLPACWERVSDCDGGPAVDGAEVRRVFDAVRIALTDRSVGRGEPSLRYRIFVTDGPPPPPDALPRACEEEPGWGPGLRGRTRACDGVVDCDCVARDVKRFHGLDRSDEVDYWDGRRLVEVPTADYDDFYFDEPLRAISNARLYVLVEDPVGNRAVLPVLRRGDPCAEPDAPPDCAPETFTLPVRPEYTVEGALVEVTAGTEAPWLQIKPCVDGLPSGDWYTPESEYDAICRRRR